MSVFQCTRPARRRPLFVQLLPLLFWGTLISLVATFQFDPRLATGKTLSSFPANTVTPTVDDFSMNPAVAGQPLTIKGTGFSTIPSENTVVFTNDESILWPLLPEISVQITEPATATELRLRTPTGIGPGHIRVEVVNQGSATSTKVLKVETTLSGLVQEDTQGNPIDKVRISADLDTGPIFTKTGPDGIFVLQKVPKDTLLAYDVDGTPDYGSILPRRKYIIENHDNRVLHPIKLHKITSSPILVRMVGGETPSRQIAKIFSPSAYLETMSRGLVASPTRPASFLFPDALIKNEEDVEFVLSGSTVTFPDGATSGKLNLGVYARERAPVGLPLNLYSSVIVQIMPLGVKIRPGAKLIFRNRDKIPEGAKVRLFRLDQAKNNETLGSFIDAGPATVLQGGEFVATEDQAIKETGYYFVSIPWPTGALTGLVVDAGGRPTPEARILARGQFTYTNCKGEFTLRGVPVILPQGDKAIVEITRLRPDGKVDRLERLESVMANSITRITPVFILSEVGTQKAKKRPLTPQRRPLK